MRALLYFALLLALFGAAVVLHHHWLEDNRRESARHLLAVGAGRSEGWVKVVVGTPSGAEPLPVEWGSEAPGADPLEGAAETGALVFEHGAAPYEPVPAADIEITLDDGQTLSEICKKLYGTANPRVYQRVAEVNGLSSADAGRAGKKLFLPPTLDRLFEGAPR